MNKKIWTIIISIILISTILIANLEPRRENISKGKTTIQIQDDFSPMYASDLIKKYPQIESISKENSSEGFVNVFGGIGKNIIIVSGQNYEITSSEEFILEIEWIKK